MKIGPRIASTQAGFSVAHQVPAPISFQGTTIGQYKADLIVNGVVLLELKAAQSIDSSHKAQNLNYLRATSLEVGLLLNFGPKPEFKRFVFENSRKGIQVHSRAFAAKQ
ncbi:MAG TPA: GxxExxY protein [Candidatus Limnocylindrales bacterium]|nr:GxxExxY protein [Candidatus Limnocylindrales bacterium]